jgi:phytoene dehydrogenase-like protein
MIVIVGAGLAGLACARELSRVGRPFLLLEAAPGPGGRQRTTHRDGFTLDHGFQVVLSSYTAVANLVDIHNLNPRRFESGALMSHDDRLHHLTSPLANPITALFSPSLPFSDKSRLAALGLQLLTTTDSTLLAGCASSSDMTTASFLKRAGFSNHFMNRFARPFFGGVFLDNDLETSAGLFRLYLKRFLTGTAWLPSGGISALPRAIASKIPVECLRYNTRVASLEISNGTATGVHLGNETFLPASKVILAVDEPSACALLSRPAPPTGRSVAVIYFKTQSSLYKHPCLVLPDAPDPVVRHFVQITNIAPSYAPLDWHLVSATVLTPERYPPETLPQLAEGEITTIFPHAVGELEHLETLHVPYAVPSHPPGFAARIPFPKLPANVYTAGDWTGGASIQTALESGLHAARRLMK